MLLDATNSKKGSENVGAYVEYPASSAKFTMLLVATRWQHRHKDQEKGGDHVEYLAGQRRKALHWPWYVWLDADRRALR